MIKNVLSTTVHDEIIRNFKVMLAKRMLNNVDDIKEEDTIEIDGLTWYNGFRNDIGGSVGRTHLFYDTFRTDGVFPQTRKSCLC